MTRMMYGAPNPERPTSLERMSEEERAKLREMGEAVAKKLKAREKREAKKKKKKSEAAKIPEREPGFLIPRPTQGRGCSLDWRENRAALTNLMRRGADALQRIDEEDDGSAPMACVDDVVELATVLNDIDRLVMPVECWAVVRVSYTWVHLYPQRRPERKARLGFLSKKQALAACALISKKSEETWPRHWGRKHDEYVVELAAVDVRDVVDPKADVMQFEHYGNHRG